MITTTPDSAPGGLRFEDVSVRFGRGPAAITAVDQVSLDLPTGSTLGLVGESGSGKSTLAGIAVGLLPPTAGRVLLGDEVIAPVPGPSGRRRRIQLIFQDPYSSLDPRMTIEESIAEGLVATGRRVGAVERTRRVAELLELTHLGQTVRRSRPAQLSGGMRQRVALARALAAEPEVIIADEITSALDVSVQGSVLNLLLELQRELGLTILFVSHNLAVVRYVSDRIAVLRRGRLVELGPTDQVIGSPAHPYTQELLAAIPRLGTRMDLDVDQSTEP
ncbi:ABC transporter ATP-binding protein [Microlunatus sp. GCM10028923]|uniref:ABC transporter ATP-binding protein n=1 Tax=Microlunatus sp. GCM10028923 TaxID=3273400 RepID=UPI003614C30C